MWARSSTAHSALRHTGGWTISTHRLGGMIIAGIRSCPAAGKDV